MKEIYLCDRPENIRYVYQDDSKVFTKADVLASPEQFHETEYVFSSWGMPSFTEEEIRNCFPSLKAVFFGAGTVQYFARPFLHCGVRVFSAWGANAVPVAEYTVAQIILANKGFFKSKVFTGNNDSFQHYLGNFDATVGIIGAGMIGKLVLKMLKEYRLNLLTFDPFLPDETAREMGVQKVDLDTIFEKCNVISNHLADNEQTKGMLTGRLFEKMLPYATFLNTGRGAQVVESELIETLKKRPDLTVLLDVTEPEPPVAGSEFYTLPNCILTPHIAGSFANEVRRMGEYMREEYRKCVNGLPVKYEVTLEMLKTMA